MDERIVSERRRLDCSGPLSRELSNLRNRLESCQTGAYVAFAALSEEVELPEGFNVIAPEIEPWVENVLTDQASGVEAYVDFLCWWKCPEPAVIQAMPGDVDVDKRRRMWAGRTNAAVRLLERVREIEAALDAMDRQHREEMRSHDSESKRTLNDQIDQSRQTLDAVVRGGLAEVLQQATKVSAVVKASAIMRERFERDREKYGSWKAEEWAQDLGVSKKTVIGSGAKPNEAWKEIKAWRASNEAERVSKETQK